MSVRFVYVLMFANVINVSAGRVLLTLYALKLGASPFAIGVLAATFAVFPMSLSWLSGRLSDRFGSRWLLMFGSVGTALGMLVPYFFSGLPAVFIAGAMNGLSLTFFTVSTQNLVGLLSAPDQRAKNYSNYSLVGSVTTFIGPLFAGFSIDHFGYAVTFLYFVSLSSLPITLLAIWGGRLPRGTRKAAPAGGIRDMVSAPGMRRVLATSSLMFSGRDVFQFYLPVYGHGIGLSASTIGILLATNSGAGFVSRMLLTRLIERFKEEKVLAYAFFLGAASFLLVPFYHSGMALALIAFMFGLGMGCGGPIVTMLTFSHAAEGRSGEAMGLRMTANQLTRAVGPVVFGSLGSAFGLPSVFWVNALMLGAGGILSQPKE